MPARRTLHVSVEEREAREDLRDHTPKPYVRERAAAFLLIASGVPPAVVARERLLRPRHPETVSRWRNRWEAEGIDSLPHPGRTRAHARFFPLTAMTLRRRLLRWSIWSAVTRGSAG